MREDVGLRRGQMHFNMIHGSFSNPSAASQLYMQVKINSFSGGLKPGWVQVQRSHALTGWDFRFGLFYPEGPLRICYLLLVRRELRNRAKNVEASILLGIM